MTTKPYMKIAQAAAEFSKDPSSKVGAVIVGPGGETIATGYNGFIAGCDEAQLSWERPAKYLYVIHAEMNAIMFAERKRLHGCTMYITHGPCVECLKHTIQKGIRKIVYEDASIVRDRGTMEQKTAIANLISATGALVTNVEGQSYISELFG